MALKKKTIQIDAVHIFNSSNNTINLITCYKPLSLEASPESLVRSLEGTLAKASGQIPHVCVGQCGAVVSGDVTEHHHSPVWVGAPQHGQLGGDGFVNEFFGRHNICGVFGMTLRIVACLPTPQ